MKRIHLLTLLVGLALSAGSGCCWNCCENVQEFRQPLSAAAFAYVPYDSNSTFTMRHNGGATVNFSASGGKIVEDAYDCEGCCERYIYETSTLLFQGDAIPMTVRLVLYSTIDELGTGPDRLSMTFGSNVGAGITLDGDPCISSPTTCLDSMQVQGVMYRNIFWLHTNTGDTTLGKVKDVWYSKQDGFIKWSMYGGEYWEVMP